MVRARRIWVAATALLAVAGASPGAAVAQGQPPSQSGALTAAADADGTLPPGWGITGGGSAQQQLVWRSDRPVPMGDARVEFATER